MFSASSAARYVPDPKFKTHGKIVLSNGVEYAVWSKESGLHRIRLLKDAFELTDDETLILIEEVRESILFDTNRQFLNWAMRDDPKAIFPIQGSSGTEGLQLVRKALLPRSNTMGINWDLD